MTKMVGQLRQLNGDDDVKADYVQENDYNHDSVYDNHAGNTNTYSNEDQENRWCSP